MSKDIERKLLIERQKLSALLEITNAVNRNYKIDELMSQFQDVMRDYIGVNKLAFINNVNQWQCILHYGVNDACEDFDYSSLTQFKTPTFTNDTAFDKLDEFELILPVFHKEKPLSYLLIGGIGEGEMINFIQNHVGFVQTLANVVSVAIETKTLAKEVLKKKLEEKDMEFAAEMQKLLLPDDLPSNQHLNISATYIAKNMVSGDYYDFFRLNENEYVFCIADVSGKGLSAAMLMANFQATLKANVKYNHGNLTLVELVSELNKSIVEAAKGEKFITFFIGYYNEKTRILKFINAGHNYPILIHQNNFKQLKTGSTALGIFDPLPEIQSLEIEIKPNTIIVCFTDGLVEVENTEGEQFQTKRLADSISSYSYLNMSELNKAIIRDVDKFKGENPYPDDTAILSLRII